MKYSFNDKIGSRDRLCKYGIVHQGEFFTAEKAAEKKLAVFKEMNYAKDGKHSNTDWEVHAKSAKLVVVMSPFEGWSEDYDTCIEHVMKSSASYGAEVTQEEAKVAFEALYPTSCQKTKKILSAIAELI